MRLSRVDLRFVVELTGIRVMVLYLRAWYRTHPLCLRRLLVSDYRFKLGIYLPELDLPFDQALAAAKDIGAEFVRRYQ